MSFSQQMNRLQALNSNRTLLLTILNQNNGFTSTADISPKKTFNKCRHTFLDIRTLKSTNLFKKIKYLNMILSFNAFYINFVALS